MKNLNNQFLRQLGVFGFDNLEAIIIAALISEDPLLLVGKAGTGKTFLLNSLSEAMGLEHRHYNASLLSFDDLVGFPVPASDGSSVSFLQTPATVWGAQSVLIDELSRCKPETQNKIFSVIHERRVQGIALPDLRFRWAAMNPLNRENDNDADRYDGSIALDQALADRFAWIVQVPDWPELSTEEQSLVINPFGENLLNPASGILSVAIAELHKKFLETIKNCHPDIILYSRITTTLLGQAGFRISPRRARLIARNLISLLIAAEYLGLPVKENHRDALFRLGLKWSIPQRAWLPNVPDHIIDAAHAEAIKIIATTNPAERWMHEFLNASALEEKFDLIVNGIADRDTVSLAVLRLLNQPISSVTAIFAFVTLPFFVKRKYLTDEALDKLTEIGTSIFEFSGEVSWRVHRGREEPAHPELSACEVFINSEQSSPKRAERARQVLLYLVLNQISVPEPNAVEEILEKFYQHVRNAARKG